MPEEIKDHTSVSSKSPSDQNKSPEESAQAGSTQQTPSGPASVQQSGERASDGADRDQDQTGFPPDGVESEGPERIRRMVDDMIFAKIANAGSIFIPHGTERPANGALSRCRSQNSQHCEDEPVVCTTNKVFPDGSALELVRNPNGALSLLEWNGTFAEINRQFVKDNDIYIPPRKDSAILHALRLPAKIAEYGSTAKLYAEIFQLIARVARSPVATPLTFLVFATWLTDVFDRAPHVWIVAPPTTAAAPLRQLLSLLCRRTLVMPELSTACYSSLPTSLQPTILTDVVEPTPRTLSRFRTSSRHGILIAGSGKAWDSFGAHIVFANESLRVPANAGFPLELMLSPVRAHIPMPSSAEAASIADEYQSKLLKYRLVNRSKVRAPVFDLSQFAAPMQELAYTLGASIVDDDDLQSKIVPYLKSQDAEICSDRSSQSAFVVIVALLARCHRTAEANLPVRELTVEIGMILAARGEEFRLSPERIGWALRDLGLQTECMAGGYKRLVLYEDVRKLIHEQALAHDILTIETCQQKCAHCAAIVAAGKMDPYPAEQFIKDFRQAG